MSKPTYIQLFVHHSVENTDMLTGWCWYIWIIIRCDFALDLICPVIGCVGYNLLDMKECVEQKMFWATALAGSYYKTCRFRDRQNHSYFYFRWRTRLIWMNNHSCSSRLRVIYDRGMPQHAPVLRYESWHRILRLTQLKIIMILKHALTIPQHCRYQK